MKVGIRYVVTKGSDDGTFSPGDHISLAEDGSITCQEAFGWINACDVAAAIKGMEAEIDWEWVESMKKKLRDQLAILDDLPGILP